MNYQKKSKSHFMYIFLLIFTPLLILSFTPRKFSKSQKKSKQAVFGSLANQEAGINYLQCFKIEKGTIDKYLQGGHGKKRMILELGTNNITSADPTFILFSYLAKNHRTHGANVTADELTALDPVGKCFEFEADKRYIIGNNYVTLKKLEEFIDKLPAGGYSYLKFTPIITATNHIAFRFSAYKTVNNKDELVTPIETFSGFDETNPCPPNKPND